MISQDQNNNYTNKLRYALISPERIEIYACIVEYAQKLDLFSQIGIIYLILKTKTDKLNLSKTKWICIRTLRRSGLFHFRIPSKIYFK